MANVRMMSSGDGKHTTTTVSGRSYTCALGATIDVPDFDAAELESNGWIRTPGTVGATSARPTNPTRGTHFNDTTVGSIVTWDGVAWRHVQSGSSV